MTRALLFCVAVVTAVVTIALIGKWTAPPASTYPRRRFRYLYPEDKRERVPERLRVWFCAN